MLLASGGPRSSTAWRDSVCRLSSSALSDCERCPGAGAGSAAERDPENHDTGTPRPDGRRFRLHGAPAPGWPAAGCGFGGLGRRQSARGARGRQGSGPALLGRLHVDAAAEAAAVLEADPGRREVAQHRRRPADQDLLAREQVAVHLPGDAHHLRVDVGVDLARLTDGDVVPWQVDLALDLAEDRQVLVAGDVADDGDRRADGGQRLTAPGDGARRRQGGLRRAAGRTDSSSRLFHMDLTPRPLPQRENPR